MKRRRIEVEGGLEEAGNGTWIRSSGKRSQCGGSLNFAGINIQGGVDSLI